MITSPVAWKQASQRSVAAFPQRMHGCSWLWLAISAQTEKTWLVRKLLDDNAEGEEEERSESRSR